MNPRKTVSVLIGISIICILLVVFLAINYLKPKYDNESTESLASIKELKGMLDSFPSRGGIEYVRRRQAGTVGIFFMGKALPEEVKRFCDRENCEVLHGEEYRQVWQDRLTLYKVQENAPISGENVLYFSGPEALRNNRYRISFLYMPDEQAFLGEVFFFR